MVAAVATDEPHTAPKAPAERMAAMPRPPRMWPTQAAAALNKARLRPPWVANWPINKKSGITLKSYAVSRATALPLSRFKRLASLAKAQ